MLIMTNFLNIKRFYVIAHVVIVTLVLFPSVTYSMEKTGIEASFQRFNQQWMQGLYKREEREKKNLVCKKVKGYYVAEYTGYSKTYSSTIKRTNCKETPYIGILNYREKKFVSHAKTFEETLHGPFNLIYECPVTEIFAFSNGEWLY